MKQIQRLASVITLAVMAGCGGGGGGGDDTSATPAPAPGAPAPAPAPTLVLPAVTATLATGTSFEYLVTTKTAYAGPGTNTSDTDSGIFRVTLGAPTKVAGVDGFAVKVSGDTAIGGRTPKWIFLAIAGQKWLASTDGQNLTTLYDPTTASGSAGFFMDLPAARAVKVAAKRFAGDYNQYDALAFSDGATDGGCTLILSVQVCSQTSTSFGRSEYLLDGIGPVAYSYSSSVSFSGSTPGVATNSTRIELIGTSLKPANGMAIAAPPWSSTASLPTPRAGAVAAGIGGKVYLYGGTSTDAGFSPTRVDAYDPATATWSALPAAPVPLDGWAGTTVGTRAALFKGNQGYLHDPASGAWTALPARANANTVLSVSPWTHSDGSIDALVVTTGPTAASYDVWQFAVATNAWQLLGNLNATNANEFVTAAVGDKLYFIGGYPSPTGLGIGAVTELDLAAKSYRTLPGVSIGARFASAIAVGTKVYVIGGRTSPSSGTPPPTAVAQVLDTAALKVTALPSIRHARYQAAMTAIGGKLYLLGGLTTPTTMLDGGEVYNP
ncbi:hypothetical protein BH10PSE17_BH10PSE17_18790 [soil metagenome]